MERESILDVPHPNPALLHENTHHVEAIGVIRPAVPGDPDLGRPPQLPLLPPVHRLDRIPEPVPAARLHFDKRHHTFLLHHEVDVPVAAPKAALDDAPPPELQPPLRDPLSQFSECLPGY